MKQKHRPLAAGVFMCVANGDEGPAGLSEARHAQAIGIPDRVEASIAEAENSSLIKPAA